MDEGLDGLNVLVDGEGLNVLKVLGGGVEGGLGGGARASCRPTGGTFAGGGGGAGWGSGVGAWGRDRGGWEGQSRCKIAVFSAAAASPT